MLLARDDEQREDGKHGAVHGHGDAHVRKRNALEKRAHVVDGIDGDARHADIALHAGMIAVIAAMGRKIEGDRQALLARGEVAPVKRVGVLGGGEARILPDRPGLLDIHGGIGAAQERRQPRIGVQEIQAFEVARSVNRLQRQAFRRLCGGAGGFRPKIRRLPLDLREIRQRRVCHRKPSIECVRKSVKRFSDKTHAKTKARVRPEKCEAVFR